MRRIIVAVLVAVLILLCSVGVCADSESITFSIDSCTAFASDTVFLKVSVDENSGVASLRFVLDYDRNCLELVSAKDLGLLGTPMFSDDVSKQNFVIGWNYSSSAKTDYYGTGDAVILEFKVKNDAPTGDTLVKLSYNENEIFNSALRNLTLNQKVGKISVKEKTVGCEHKTFSWNITKLQACEEDGERVYRCDDCGYVKTTETLRKLEHSYKEEIIAPTTSLFGYTLHTCVYCGDSFKDNYVDKIAPQSSAPASTISSKPVLITSTPVSSDAPVQSNSSEFQNASSKPTVSGEVIDSSRPLSSNSFVSSKETESVSSSMATDSKNSSIQMNEENSETSENTADNPQKEGNKSGGLKVFLIVISSVIVCAIAAILYYVIKLKK